MSDRPELSVREGCRPVRDLPRGEFRTSLRDGEVVIDQADPEILISGELLGQIHGGSTATAWVEPPIRGPITGVTLVGSLLKIHAVNRDVTYRVTGYVHEIHGFIGELAE